MADNREIATLCIAYSIRTHFIECHRGSDATLKKRILWQPKITRLNYSLAENLRPVEKNCWSRGEVETLNGVRPASLVCDYDYRPVRFR